ncbi:hypothetical protein [Prosthecobacter sp.]|uniref:hypothetical protein n=1 Tax=Prosthecobacter sp. TaxID=1965333 RepID=UPI0024874996|nr:hypothetical protein [Prosthecobacter sp.]MDI1312933.1 hypothetical protein [Prosthecobacter sp.]
MKTTSSPLFRGVMLIAALLVPATTWWVSSRHYRASRQTETTLVAEKKAQQLPAGLKQKSETPPQRLNSGSVEFAPMQIMRTSWNGQTDPDSVWHDQRRQANIMLMKHGLPTLDVPSAMPDSPPPPSSLRITGQR